MDKPKLNMYLQLVKKLPSHDLNYFIDNIFNKLKVTVESTSDFFQKVERPLEIDRSDSLGEFIKSDYNKEGESFRSPWSNKYFPETYTPKFPPKELRELEVQMNTLFKMYTKLYYNKTAVSSVFVWELGESIENGFMCVVLIKNLVENCKGLIKGDWDSINVVNAKFYKEKERSSERIKVTYKISTTVIFNLETKTVNTVTTGNLNKQMEENYYIKGYLDYDFHCEKIGKLVEVLENHLRNQVEEIGIKKSSEILLRMRSTAIIGKTNNEQSTRLYDIFQEKFRALQMTK